MTRGKFDVIIAESDGTDTEEIRLTLPDSLTAEQAQQIADLMAAVRLSTYPDSFSWVDLSVRIEPSDR